MSAHNTFFTIGGLLIVVAIVIGVMIWKPFSNPLLVSGVDSGNSAVNATDVSVSHSASAMTVREGDHFVSVVRFDGSVFSPRILVINRGENVRFVNTSNLTMRIEADRTSTTTLPAQYQQSQSVGKNGQYELSFVNPGVWVITNLNDQSDNSAIVYVK
ncbi:hypothetical protein HY090_00655 [Candidatus Kaiserbacteria bacterium]|nr:hypothetical protein [Candidatus Kaiserbacteria bacterium]